MVFNAANEVAVDLFLKEKISYLGIHSLILQFLSTFSSRRVSGIDDIVALDHEVKMHHQSLIYQ